MKKQLLLLALLPLAFYASFARTGCAASPTSGTPEAYAETPKPAFKLTFGQKIAHALLEKRLKKQLRKQGFAVPRPLASDCDTIVTKDGRIVLGEDVEVTAEGVFYSKCGANDGVKYLIKAEYLSTVKGISYQQTPPYVFTPQEARLDRMGNIAIASSVMAVIASIFVLLTYGLNALIVVGGLLFLLLTISLSLLIFGKSSSMPDSLGKRRVRRKARTALWLLLLIVLVGIVPEILLFSYGL